MRKLHWSSLSALLVGLFSASVQAQAPVVVQAAAGRGQTALAVGFDVSGKLRAKTCSAAPCTLDGGVDLALPRELEPLKNKAQFMVVGLGEERRAIVVSFPNSKEQTTWQAVIAGALQGTAPQVIFSGYTGLVRGEDGLRSGPMIVVTGQDDDGAHSILLGEQREDLHLCGRPSILSQRALSPLDFSLKPAKFQRLSPSERQAAPSLRAERVTEPQPAPSTPSAPNTPSAPSASGPLRPIAASSAIGNPAALTDGNLDTAWAENRGGDGRGEFVVFQTPRQLPLKAFDFVLRPAHATPAQGSAPRELWLLTTTRLVKVEFPEDAWTHPGAAYRVSLEPPFLDDCLALVIESGSDKNPKTQVTLTELSAHTEFDGAKPEELVAALAGGAARAEGAKAALLGLGAAAFPAVIAGFSKLDPAGKLAALEVLEAAACSDRAEVLLDAWSSSEVALQNRADQQLRRCGNALVPTLLSKLPGAAADAQVRLAAKLAQLDANSAVSAITPLLRTENAEIRRGLRSALLDAARKNSAHAALRQVLADTQQPPEILLEVLRALDQQAAEFEPEASAALQRLGQATAAFRTQYLLIEPAASLAAQSASAQQFLKQSLASTNAFLRAHAARSVRHVERFQAELSQALQDPQVRVREAAVLTLSAARAEFAASGLLERLKSDAWPIVRAAAASAIGRLAQNPLLDHGLEQALADRSLQVRKNVLGALGQHRVVQAADRIRTLLTDPEEPAELRARAALALGDLCDQKALDVLTRYAQRLADPVSPAEDQTIGAGALTALSALHPSDLNQRLMPLRAAKVPAPARRAAEAAIKTPGTCSTASSAQK